MNLVYYSLAVLGSDACERQWVQSIRSMRRFNASIHVLLFVYGPPARRTLEEADRTNVEVVCLGDYADSFAHLPHGRAEVLAGNPTLHKLLSLRHLPASGIDQVLYLDCDTYFFSDVACLFRRYRSHHFTAREEPGCKRSHHGYDPACIDESALHRLALSEGLVPIPPYNTGVVMLNGGLWRQLAALGDEFLDFVWRLIGKGDDPRDHYCRLPYPSANAWIVEEIATWLTLGRFPGLTHDAFDRCDVVQNGESAERLAGRPDPIVAHYFSGWEERFFAHTRRL